MKLSLPRRSDDIPIELPPGRDRPRLLDPDMPRPLAVDARFLGDVAFRLLRMVLGKPWLQVIFTPLAAIDDRNRILAVPGLAWPDQSVAAAATAPAKPVENPQSHPRRHGGVRGGADPFGKVAHDGHHNLSTRRSCACASDHTSNAIRSRSQWRGSALHFAKQC